MSEQEQGRRDKCTREKVSVTGGKLQVGKTFGPFKYKSTPMWRNVCIFIFYVYLLGGCVNKSVFHGDEVPVKCLHMLYGWGFYQNE